ncbi:unnamed protein product, partial [Leptidea sinapis]
QQLLLYLSQDIKIKVAKESFKEIHKLHSLSVLSHSELELEIQLYQVACVDYLITSDHNILQQNTEQRRPLSVDIEVTSLKGVVCFRLPVREKQCGPRGVQVVNTGPGHTFVLDEDALAELLLQDDYGSGGGGDWLGSDDQPLAGFSWRGGSERDTTGILMWSEIFKATLDNGEKGAFDSESTVRDCATVFALSTMLSSVQIYNLSQNIQEDDLQHLQLFTEYGRLALEDGGRTPFQRLQFVVSDKQHPELQSLRKHITSCFGEIGCFLMPHPGLKVATSPTFDGRLSDIEVEFKRALQQLVPMLLAPDNLVVKEINGQRVRAKELLVYFKAYMNIYKGNDLPEPKSMLVATAEANNLTAVAEARELYTNLMEEICGGAKPYLQGQLLETEHKRIKDKALLAFRSKRKMGGDEFSQAYCEQLTQAARTPSVFFALALLCYVLSGLLGLLALYSGEMRELGVSIDDTANWMWDNVMKPVYQAGLEKGMEHAAAAAADRVVGTATANGKHKQL